MEQPQAPRPTRLLVKKLHPDARLPKKGTPAAAGYDLCALQEVLVPARGKAKVPTGLAWTCPPQTYGRIAPRSGLAWKHSIDVGAGVVDEDYRGEVCVILFNLGDQDFQVNKFDRVAQLIIEKIEPTEVEEVPELTTTDRGDGGFGSTGILSQQPS